MRTTYQVWQVGWEAEQKTVECEGDHETGECPACRVVGLPPTGIDHVDPVVIGFRKEGSEVEHYRRVDWIIMGELVAQRCRRATETDKIHARDCAEAARLGMAAHWHHGERVYGGVS